MALLSLILGGCSNTDNIQPGAASSQQVVSGVAASGAPIEGTVTLADASIPPRILSIKSAVNGAYSFNVKGLKGPYLLYVSWPTGNAVHRMYSFADGPGKTNINPFSHAVCASSAGVSDLDSALNNPSSGAFKAISSSHAAVSRGFMGILAPLFNRYRTAKNPMTDDYDADHTGLDALFDDVNITLSGNVLSVTNKQTGAVIYTAPLSNPSSGTLNIGNMPGGSGVIDGAALYTNKCSACHGPLSASAVAGATAAAIQSAIRSVSTMSNLSNITALEIQTIASALSSASTTTSPPAPCAYTYDAWGTCLPDGTQTRSVLTTSPQGCTGTPMTSQACVYTPPAPTPCTYTYDVWGSCQPDGTQTRPVLASAPAGCVGTPIVSQTCDYIPPVCIFTYSDWGACQPDSTQSRTVLTQGPSGCTGLPVLVQACVYTPPVPVTLRDVVMSCTGCHGLTVNTTVLRSGDYTVIGRDSATWLLTVNSMVGQGAKLTAGTTAQGYADFLATLP